MDTITLALAKAYVKEQLIDGGELVGKNVTISSITPIEGGNQITFSYTLDDGTVKEQHLNVMDGKDAYEYAQAGGYTGTEEEFAAKMAQVIPAQIQADWEQNDETQLDYVKNKPFGNEESETILISEQEVINGSEVSLDSEYEENTEGKEYVVIYDGVKYQTVASMVRVSMMAALVMIGNPSIMDSTLSTGNNEPFCIILNETYFYMTFEDGSAHMVGVNKIATSIKQIEEKYIPDSIARTEDIPTDEHINELINTALGTNLTEVASLVGGDA